MTTTTKAKAGTPANPHDPRQGHVSVKDGDHVICDEDGRPYVAHVAPDGVARIAEGPYAGRRCDGR